MSSFENAIENYKGVQIAKKRLLRIENQLNKQYAKLFDLEFKLDKEFEDVKNLTKLSLYNLFYTVLGDKEQQYEIEKQEYLMAIMHYSECKNVIEILEFEQGILKEKINSEKESIDLLKAMTLHALGEIEKKYPGAAFDLKFLKNQSIDHLKYMREVREAYTVALKTQDLFEKLIDHLRKARRAETWGYTYEERKKMKKLKVSSLDAAQKAVHKAKPLLDSLHHELLDIYKFKSLYSSRNFPEFDFFNDIYYDRLISDWIFQERILSSITHIFGTLESIKSVVKSLKIEIDATQKQIDYVEKRQQTILFDYINDDLKEDNEVKH